MSAIFRMVNKPFKAQLARNGKLQVVATTDVFTKNESDMKIKKRNIKHDTATRVLHCCYC